MGFVNSWIPDAILAVGQSSIAVTEENTLSVLRLTLGKEKTDLQKNFPKKRQHLGEVGECSTSRGGVAELLAFCRV